MEIFFLWKYTLCNLYFLRKGIKVSYLSIKQSTYGLCTIYKVFWSSESFVWETDKNLKSLFTGNLPPVSTSLKNDCCNWSQWVNLRKNHAGWFCETDQLIHWRDLTQKNDSFKNRSWIKQANFLIQSYNIRL